VNNRNNPFEEKLTPVKQRMLSKLNKSED